MDGQHNQHRPHLCILIWILIRIRIARYFEFFLCALTLREGRGGEGERERQSKGNLPGDCFNIPLRASTCNDDDDDAASGPGGRHQVRGTQYQLPTTAGVLLVYAVCPFRPEYIFLFCHLSCRALFIAGSYLLPPT